MCIGTPSADVNVSSPTVDPALCDPSAAAGSTDSELLLYCQHVMTRTLSSVSSSVSISRGTTSRVCTLLFENV